MKKKITLIHYNMVFGGVEKVLLNLLENLNKNKFKVKLILFEKKGELLNSVPQNIEIIFLEKKDDNYKKNIVRKICKNILNIFFYIKQLKKIIKEDEILLNLNIRFIVMNIPLLFFKNKKIGWFHTTIKADEDNFLVKLNYRLFNQYNLIYNVSKKGKKDFDEKLPKLKLKNKVLYNSFDIEKLKNLSEEKVDEYNYLVAVGRIVNEHKGFDILIEAIQRLKEDGIDEKLLIIGDGPDKWKLEEMIKKYNLEKNIILKGFDKNPYKWMKNSKVFILSSNYEGFGLVLVEALACKVPVISTDCNCGPREILEDGNNGLLIPVGDVELLKEGIKKILQNKKLYNQFKNKALNRALDFSNEKIIEKLEKDILEL